MKKPGDRPQSREVEDALDRLYGETPASFLRTRNQLVKTLKADGRREAAARVGRARRPTLAAWALNQAVRRDPEGLAELAAAARRVRAAQRRMLSGVQRHGLREADQGRRAAVERLTREALSALESLGRSGRTQRRRIVDTLEAAAAEPDTAEALTRGRLERERPPPAGFGDLSGLTVLEGGRPGAAEAPRQWDGHDRAEQRDANERAAKRDAGERDADERAAKRAVRDARARVDRARRAAERLRGRAEAAGATADDARAEAREARRQAEAARAEAERLEHEAERARRAAESAERAAERADRARERAAADAGARAASLEAAETEVASAEAVLREAERRAGEA